MNDATAANAGDSSAEIKKNVLVLVFSNLKHDARVSRQVRWLAKKYSVTVVCFDAEETGDATFLRVRQTPLTLLRKSVLATALMCKAYSTAYRILYDYAFIKERLKNRYDLIVANDIDTLPLAFQIAGSGKIVFDAHEYAPRHFENNKIWRLFFQPFYTHLCKRYIPRTDGMLTVGEGLANAYAAEFQVQPLIITNAGRYHEIAPSVVVENKIRLVHHGIINQSRRLELMLELMTHLDARFTLDLILMTSDYASAKTKAYISAFKKKAEEDPRVRMLKPVKSDEIVQTINRYDVGVFLIPPVNFNYANTLPNKLFDFIQARLAIAIGPTPEMASIVTLYQNGVVAPDFEPRSLARELNALRSEDIMTMKRSSGTAAKNLNAGKNEILFDDYISRILATSTARKG